MDGERSRYSRYWRWQGAFGAMWHDLGWLIDHQRQVDAAKRAIAAAVAEERERLIDLLRPDYPDAVRMLEIRASSTEGEK